MTFRALPTQLYPVAEGARALLGVRWGVKPGQVRIESPIAAGVRFATTLHAKTADHHWICVDVSESAYPRTIDAVVLECRNLGLPVKLFIAVPPNETAGFQQQLAEAKRNGVGVLVVGVDGTASILLEGLSLSLTGVREPILASFPNKYRSPLGDAIAAFKGGNPSKGCSIIYDEVEHLTRRIADRAKRKKAWRNLPAGTSDPGISSNTAWARVARKLLDHLDGRKCGMPRMTDPLLGRIVGLTDYRNESGHKPKTVAALKKRDEELRTRFENAHTVLGELIKASR